MAEVVLFHHAQGLTPGVAAFADELRHAGHIVHTPDLFDGHTFNDLEQGMKFVEALGFGEIMKRGEQAVEALPAELVYAGFSLGVVPARSLPKPGRERAGQFSAIPACRSQSLGRPGQWACRCRCMAWMPIRSSWVRATSTPRGHSSQKPRRASFSSTLVTNTTSQTAPCLRTMQKHPRSCCRGYWRFLQRCRTWRLSPGL